MHGWSCKDAAEVLDIPSTKITNALYQRGAAFEKLAKLMLADAARTLVDLNVAMERLKTTQRSPRSEDLLNLQLASSKVSRTG